MKKNITTVASLLIVIIAILALVGVYKMNGTLLVDNPSQASSVSSSTSVTPASFIEAIKHGTYTLGEEKVILTNGMFSQPVAQGSASMNTVSLFGEPVYGDLDNDDDTDAAIMLVANGGGTGSFFYAVLVINQNGTYVPTQTMLLGDRIAPQTINITSGRAVYNFAERKPREPMTAQPSVGKSVTVNYNPQTNEIGELAVGFEGEANPSSMNLTMKKWEWVKTTMNDGKVTTPKKAGVFSVTFGKDNMVHVLTDCNTMNGSYSASNKSLAFKQMASTMMYCEGSQEQDFAQALNEVSSYFFTSKGELILELKMDSGTITFK